MAGLAEEGNIVDLLFESLTVSEKVLKDLMKLKMTVVRFNWYEQEPGHIQTNIKKILSNAIIRCTNPPQKTKLEKLHEAAGDFASGVLSSGKIQMQYRTSVQPTPWSVTRTVNGNGTYNAFLNRNWHVTDLNLRQKADVLEGSLVTTARKEASSVETGDISRNTHMRGNTVLPRFQTLSTGYNWRSSSIDNRQEFPDAFSVIGVANNATQMDIDSAYTNLARAYYNKQCNASKDELFQEQENMMKINKAWEMLQA